MNETNHAIFLSFPYSILLNPFSLLSIAASGHLVAAGGTCLFFVFLLVLHYRIGGLPEKSLLCACFILITKWVSSSPKRKKISPRKWRLWVGCKERGREGEEERGKVDKEGRCEERDDRERFSTERERKTGHEEERRRKQDK